MSRQQHFQPRGIQPPRVHQPTQTVSIKGNAEIDLISQAQAGQPKKMKRTYILSDPLPPMKEIDVTAYRKFIVDLIEKRGNVIRSEAEHYTDATAMPTFIKAMTHDSVNPHDRADNYEMLEHLGDATVNKSATWYLKNRFPDIVKRGDLGVQIISKQKSLITSKPFLAKYSEFLGFVKFIRYRPLNFTYSKEDTEGAQSTQVKQVVLDRSMKEDVFEAFFAALEQTIDKKEGMVGVGYAVCFKILRSLFDEQDIPYTKNDLVDAKTQLKEIFDKRKRLGDTIDYDPLPREKGELHLRIKFREAPPGSEQLPDIVMGPYSTNVRGMEGDYATNQKAVEQSAARAALKYLQTTYGPAFVRYKEGE